MVGDLAAPGNMSDALEGVDAVIHSAGLAHGMSGLPEDDYRAINTEATVGLAQLALTVTRNNVRVADDHLWTSPRHPGGELTVTTLVATAVAEQT